MEHFLTANFELIKGIFIGFSFAAFLFTIGIVIQLKAQDLEEDKKVIPFDKEVERLLDRNEPIIIYGKGNKIKR